MKGDIITTILNQKTIKMILILTQKKIKQSHKINTSHMKNQLGYCTLLKLDREYVVFPAATEKKRSEENKYTVKRNLLFCCAALRQ